MKSKDEILSQLYNPEGYHQHHIDEIFTGVENYISKYKGGIVPNVNSTIIEYTGPSTYLLYRVAYVDPETKLTTKVKITPTNTNDDEIGELLYAGIGGGRVMDSDRIYVNTTNLRNPASIDQRLRAYGSSTSYYKVFLGADISETGTVVSVKYDTNGNVVGDSIELEYIDRTDPTRMCFRPAPFNLNRALPTGELCTIVAYDDEDGMVCYQPLIIVHNQTVMNVNPYTNYVTGIHLESPYLVPGTTELRIPENFLRQSFLTEGYVDYKNGSKRKVVIGKEGMTLLGWDMLGDGSTWSGQQRNLVLSYDLADGETAPLAEVNGVPGIIQPYTITTVAKLKAYAVAIMATISFISEADGYGIRYWMVNLERNKFVEVTDKVKMGTSGTGAFKPKAYNQEQTLALTLNLKDVDPSYVDYTYVQSIVVELKGNPAPATTGYLMNYTKGGSRPYGQDLEFRVSTATNGSNNLDITANLTQKADWLDQFYYRLNAVFDVEVSSQPPEPTELVIRWDNHEITVDLDVWDLPVALGALPKPSEAETMYLIWQRRDEGGNAQVLATATTFCFNS